MEKKSPSAGMSPDLLFLPYENRIYAETSSKFSVFGENRIIICRSVYMPMHPCMITTTCLPHAEPVFVPFYTDY